MMFTFKLLRKFIRWTNRFWIIS